MFGAAFVTFFFLYYAVPTTAPFYILVAMPSRRYLIASACLLLCALAVLLPYTRKPYCDEYSLSVLSMPGLDDRSFWAFALYALVVGFAVRSGTLYLRSRRAVARGPIIMIHLVFFLLLFVSPMIFSAAIDAAGLPPQFCRPSN